MAEIIIPRRNRQRPALAEFLPVAGFREAVSTLVDDLLDITAFARASELPDSAQKALISTPESGIPIYAFVTGSTLYWYSKASVAYLNADASYMFSVSYSWMRFYSVSLAGISAAHAVNMKGFFQGSRITTNPIPKNWNMLKVTDITDMFRNCYQLGPAVEFAPRLSTAALTGFNADSLFMECMAMTSVKISCDLSGLTSLRNWFRGCTALTSFDFTEADLSAVTTASSMFEGCKALTAVDMQEAGFGGVRAHGDSMFRTCTGLKRVKFQSYTATASLAFGASMFLNCTALTEADFSRIAVSGSGSLKASDRMFSGCSALSVVYTSDDWAGGSARDVFTECPIVGGAGTAFDPEHISGEYARIDNPPCNPGYFTYKRRTDPAYVVVQTDYAPVVQIADAAEMNAKSYDAKIVPQQAGSGDPSPTNVRQIAGFTGATVTRAGKNLTTCATDSTATKNNVITNVSGNHLTAAGTATGSNTDSPVFPITPILLKAGETYTFSLNGITSSPDIGVNLRNGSTNVVGLVRVSVSGSVFTYTFSVDADAVVNSIRLRYYTANGTVVNIDGYWQLEHGSPATAYEPYAAQDYTITFPSKAGTVYGGNLHVKENGRGTLTVTQGYIASYAGETLPGAWISDRDTYSPGTSPSTGAQVVYELATPQTYRLTAPQIAMLYGTNNLWADTGDMAVEYVAEIPAD